MYNAVAAFKDFLSGFDLPVHAENTVPDDAELPYITFSLGFPEWNQKASAFVRVWYRTKANTKVIKKADQITKAIGQMKNIPFTDGYLTIWPETPLIQILTDGDDPDVRYAYINLSVNCYNLPGI